MALEVKVFSEITAYQPKIIFGLTWRQLAAAAVTLPVVVGVYVGCYVAGWEDLGVVLVTVGVIPAAAFGWVRPMGINFESYVGYWWAHRRSSSPYVYCQEVKELNDDETRKTPAGKGAKAGAWEAQH